MSAWRISKKHIDYMVSAAVSRTFRPYGEPLDVDELGQLLWDENLKSLRDRYPREDWPEDRYTFSFRQPHVDPVVLMKLVHCYEYQTCEHAEWEQSRAFEICQRLIRAACENAPGYTDAPWGIS